MAAERREAADAGEVREAEQQAGQQACRLSSSSDSKCNSEQQQPNYREVTDHTKEAFMDKNEYHIAYQV